MIASGVALEDDRAAALSGEAGKAGVGQASASANVTSALRVGSRMLHKLCCVSR